MKKIEIVGLTLFIMGWGMYLSHKINLTQRLIMKDTDYLISLLPMQFGLMYLGTIFVGFILLLISLFLNRSK